MMHRTVRGRLAYTSKKPDRMNQPRGDERFTFTHHTDGKVVLRAYCEIEEPSPTVMRDVVYAMDEHGKPMDCTVRLVVGDKFNGSGWIRFTPNTIECESYGPSIGRVSQRVDLTEPIDGFGTHPVVADAYLLGRMEWTTIKRRTLSMYLPSPDLRGATPPILAPIKIDAEFVADETITVKAGTFKTKHFRFLDVGDSGFSTQHPPYDVWVTDDADTVMVQGGVGGSMLTWYELVELER